MAKLYPHKQTVIIFIVCAIVVGAMIWYSREQNITRTQNEQGTIATAPINSDQASTTTASTDWQKQFFGLATSSIKLSAKKSAVTNTEAPLSMTSEFGRGLFTQYANLKQVGLTKDADIVSSAISGVITQAFSGSDKPKIYNESDISVDRDDNATTLKEYGNSIGILFLTYMPTQDDATLALAGMQGKDPAYKEKIGANIAKYKIILAQLLNIQVPKSVSEYHLALVNGMGNEISIALALRVSETDPLRAIDSLSLYKTTFSSILENMANIKIALAGAGITYNSVEGGNFFKLTKI